MHTDYLHVHVDPSLYDRLTYPKLLDFLILIKTVELNATMTDMIAYHKIYGK